MQNNSLPKRASQPSQLQPKNCHRSRRRAHFKSQNRKTNSCFRKSSRKSRSTCPSSQASSRPWTRTHLLFKFRLAQMRRKAKAYKKALNNVLSSPSSKSSRTYWCHRCVTSRSKLKMKSLTNCSLSLGKHSQCHNSLRRNQSFPN